MRANFTCARITSIRQSRNKINALLEHYEGAGFTIVGLPADPGWISRLLSSKELRTWISATVDDFDMKFDHYLTGTAFTDQDRTIYELLNGPHHDPFGNV